MVLLKLVTRLNVMIIHSLAEPNSMTTENNKSFAEKNEDRIQNFVENLNEKGAEKKEQKKDEFAAKESDAKQSN